MERERLDRAIAGAKGYLLSQAREGFPEALHVMSFPRRAGFRVERECQASDVFARSILAGVLLDCAELDSDPSFRRAVEALSRREADYVAAAKLGDRVGGWSYFPELPELPPDLDSLSAAALLFARAAPEHVPLLIEPLRLALDGIHPDGAVETWLIAPGDGEKKQRQMRRAVQRFWGSEVDLEVCARFFFALSVLDPRGNRETIRRGARYLAERQDPSGCWGASWYFGSAYATGLVLHLLRAVGSHEHAIARAVEGLLASQRPDGGWVLLEEDPHETALALWALGDDATPPARERAAGFLLDYQTRDGHWKASPWIRMNAGRARGDSGPVLSHGSATITASFCLRALLSLRSRGGMA